MAITARRLRRLEAWSDWRAAGGTRVAVVDDAISIRASVNLERENLVVVLPLDSPAASSLGVRKVLRVDQDDATFDEYRIVDRNTDDDNGQLVITAVPFRINDLQGSTLISRKDSDGVVVFDFESLGLTPTEMINTWILPALAAAGFGWISLGTITPTARLEMTFAWDTPLAALLRLASATQSELDLRRNGNTGYFIDLVTKVNSAGQMADLRVDKNLVNVLRSESALEQATRVYPKGASDGEFQATMSRASWLVTNVVGLVVTLTDPAGGKGPIQFDNQLASVNQLAYLRKTSGALTALTASSAANQTVTVASATGITIGDLIQFRANSAGDDLVFLEGPAAASSYGVKSAVKEVPDVPSTNNLVKNPVMRAWPGTLPTNWNLVGTPTIAKQVAAPFTAIGGASIKVTSNAPGQGVISDPVAIFPTTLAPYLSGYARLWLASGNARVELVIATPSGEKVFPLLPDVATPSLLGQWADVGASGFDANGVAATTAAIRIVQNGIAASVFYVDAAQITQSASQQPFFEGSGGTRLWQEANEALRTGSSPLVSYSVPLVDLEAIDPVTWSDSALIIGANARIVDARLGVDVITRIVGLERDYIDAQRNNVTLSNRFDDLTDLLATAARPERAPGGGGETIPGAELPELRIANFREIGRSPTQVTLGWTVTGAVEELWLYLLNLTPPVVSDPWALLSAQPPIRLTPDTVSYTVPIPKIGTITYGRLVPMGSARVPMSTTPARGRAWDFTLQPTDAIPQISLPSQLVAPSGLTVDLKFLVTDPAGLGGTLKVWTNHLLTGDADSTTVAEGSKVVASTNPPYEASSITVFDLSGGGTFNLLDDIRVQPGRGKRVFAEFVNTDGVSSGVQSILLAPSKGAVDDNNELIAGIIHDYTPFASGIAPLKIVGALPVAGDFVDQVVVLTTNHKLYRWTGSAWTSAVATVDLTGTIDTAQITDAAITAAKVGALAIIAGKVAAAVIGTTELGPLAVTAAKIAGHTITANEIVALTITSAEIAAGAIIAAKIGAGEVTAGKIAALSIVAGDIAALTITGAKIVAGTITSDKLVANSITAGQIQAGAIGTTELAALAVTAGKIATGTITADKMNVTTLSAIVADLGTITAGLIQNLVSSPTAGLRISSGYSKPGTWTRYIDFAGTGTEPFIKHEKFELLHDGSVRMNKIVVILTSGSSWTVPADFNPFLNSIEIIGGGGGGAGGITNTQGGGGGAGGKFNKVVGFNPGSAATIAYAIGAGGSGGASAGGAGGNGGTTSWGSALVAGGGNGSAGSGGAGGFGTSGQGGTGSVGSASRGGGGGGGAAGPNSVGTGGADAVVGTGGAGGSGGGPNIVTGAGTGWDENPGSAHVGAGGGGGGGSGGIGGIAGYAYGGGGGGGSCSSGNSASGGAGGQGVIVITYFPIGTF